MRKVQVPLMGRHVGTFCQIAKIAEIAMIDDLGVVCDSDPVHFHGVAVVNKVEEGWKSITQADASPACVADVINPF
jgi:hypothetical protein